MYISLVLHSVLCSFIVPKEQSVVRLCSVYMTFILKKSCGALHKTELFVQKVSILFNISLYLSPNWFGIRGQRTKIKRESGVNPGQSRCCEALYNILSINQLQTTDGKRKRREGPIRCRVSQKTCHSMNKSFFTSWVRKESIVVKPQIVEILCFHRVDLCPQGGKHEYVYSI